MEYAIAAIQNAAAAVGIQTKSGIVIATEKRVASKLLAPSKTSEKVYKLDEHVRIQGVKGVEQKIYRRRGWKQSIDASNMLYMPS